MPSTVLPDMIPQEYRERRKAMNLTQAQLARHLGVNVKTIERRESEDGRITHEMVMALQWLAQWLVTGGAIVV